MRCALVSKYSAKAGSSIAPSLKLTLPTKFPFVVYVPRQVKSSVEVLQFLSELSWIITNGLSTLFWFKSIYLPSLPTKANTSASLVSLWSIKL